MNIFIILALFFDALLTSTPVRPATYSVETYSALLSVGFSDIGLNPDGTFFYHTHGSLGSTYSPRSQSIHHWCGRQGSLSARFLYPEDVLYQSPALFAVIGHEKAHFAQGVSCATKTAEAGAELISWYVLSQYEMLDHQQALWWTLRNSAVLAALEEDCDHSWIKKMSPEAQRLYQYADCGGHEEYTLALKMLLEDEDGIIDLPSTPELDMNKLKELLWTAQTTP